MRGSGRDGRKRAGAAAGRRPTPRRRGSGSEETIVRETSTWQNIASTLDSSCLGKKPCVAFFREADAGQGRAEARARGYRNGARDHLPDSASLARRLRARSGRNPRGTSRRGEKAGGPNGSRRGDSAKGDFFRGKKRKRGRFRAPRPSTEGRARGQRDAENQGSHLRSTSRGSPLVCSTSDCRGTRPRRATGPPPRATGTSRRLSRACSASDTRRR